MTGPEHYEQAQTLLASAWKRSASVDDFLIQTPERRAELIATAQVHATLALAAEQAVANAGDMPIRDCEAWEKVAGVQS